MAGRESLLHRAAAPAVRLGKDCCGIWVYNDNWDDRCISEYTNSLLCYILLRYENKSLIMLLLKQFSIDFNFYGKYLFFLHLYDSTKKSMP